MKVLHLASFTGNIGDNANHSGFRRWFETVYGQPVCWSESEIREFYWKERKFDESFVQITSQHDLIVIGGGNYFELWVDHSHTGTSIDIPPDIFSQIKAPVFFNALGCDTSQGVTENSVTKFNHFIKILTGSDQYLVTVRNDGAQKALEKYVPAEIAGKIVTIPDGGFFLEYEEITSRFIKSDNKLIGINLACDMPDIRYKNFGGGTDGYYHFCDEFAKMLEGIAAENPVEFLLFPHIHSDLKVISDVVARLNDRLRRTRVKVAPYLTGPEGAKYVFGLYRCCDLVLGMRFHANVCPIGMGIPTIGLCNYPQIMLLHDELGHDDGFFNVEYPGFSSQLHTLIVEVLSNEQHPIKTRMGSIKNDLIKLRSEFEPILKMWLFKNKIF